MRIHSLLFIYDNGTKLCHPILVVVRSACIDKRWNRCILFGRFYQRSLYLCPPLSSVISLPVISCLRFRFHVVFSWVTLRAILPRLSLWCELNKGGIFLYWIYERVFVTRLPFLRFLFSVCPTWLNGLTGEKKENARKRKTYFIDVSIVEFFFCEN